ncbi:MAG: YciI family protein [Opitutus sp.]
MKYICLAYYDSETFASAPEADQQEMMDRCCEYDDQLRANGNFKGGEALQPPETATTLRYSNGRIVITDGPFAETKEQLGGILILEARDLNHAIEIISKHPGTKIGPWEVRPAADLSEIVRQSEVRRRAEKN